MSPKLQNKLYKKFPTLFSRRKLDEMESCMYFGIECDDGWYDLIYRMCEKLQEYGDENGLKFQLEQVKQKFGALRVSLYNEFSSANILRTSNTGYRTLLREQYNFAQKIINKYEEHSATVCEETGGEGQLCKLYKSSTMNYRTLSTMSATLLGFTPVKKWPDKNTKYTSKTSLADPTVAKCPKEEHARDQT